MILRDLCGQAKEFRQKEIALDLSFGKKALLAAAGVATVVVLLISLDDGRAEAPGSVAAAPSL